VNGVKLRQVNWFPYLGSTITADYICKREICARIARAKEAFNTKKRIVKRNSLSKEMKSIRVECYCVEMKYGVYVC